MVPDHDTAVLGAMRRGEPEVQGTRKMLKSVMSCCTVVGHVFDKFDTKVFPWTWG